jgi:hypothetical protein
VNRGEVELNNEGSSLILNVFVFDLAFIQRFHASFSGEIVFPKPGEDYLAPEFVAQRLANKLPRKLSDPHVCWEWQGTRNKYGYGTLTYDHRTAKAHRIAYTICVGPIPEGMQVLHYCDNPPCINPKHLFLGTVKDNVHDALRKGRMKKPPIRPGKTSQVRGVHFNRSHNYWIANVWRNAKSVRVGYFKTEAEAIDALRKAKQAIVTGDLAAVIASLKKPRRKAKPKPPKHTPGQGVGWITRSRHGAKYAVLTAIDSLSKSRFTGQDAYEAVQRLFPGVGITRAHISSLLWKLSSSDEAKYHVTSFHKVSVSRGGKTQSEYEKVVASAA